MPDEEDEGHAPGAADDEAAADHGGDDEGADDDQWRFSVDDVGEDATGEAEEAEEEGSIFGPPPGIDTSVDPGDPDVENVLFVALGVAASVALMAAVVGLI